ncbi:Golgi apyrase, partial [Rhizophlyctis rosea]
MDPDTAVLNLQLGYEIDSKFDDQHTGDEWSRNRRFAVVIDAGSSGSRVLVYSWKDPLYVRKIAAKDSERGASMLSGLPVIEQGSQTGEWQFKEDPGISSYAHDPQNVTAHLRPLLDFAETVVPEHKRPSTPVYLLATAGMRLINVDAQDSLLAIACKYVQRHYKFSVDGGCNLHFRVISGELEGIYGWTSVNYLKNGFGHDDPNSHTFGFLDMGGASTQVAFEPTKEMAELHDDDLTALKMRSIDGTELSYKVFVTTFLGFGMNEARRRYLEVLVSGKGVVEGSTGVEGGSGGSDVGGVDSEKRNTRTAVSISSSTSKRQSTSDAIPDPCLPRDLLFTDTSHVPINSPSPPTLRGTGDFTTCLDSLFPLLNKSLPCPDTPCLFNGVHAPIKDFGKHNFLGVSEYWYTSSDIYGLGGVYDHGEFKSKSLEFCSKPWEEILGMYEAKTWPMVHDAARLRLQCFKSAWIMNILHEGLGIPTERVTVAEHGVGSGVGSKGKTSGSFESVNEIRDFSVSWTLGAVLFHAAATVPLKATGREGWAWGYGGWVVMVLVGGGVIGVVGVGVWRRLRRGVTRRNRSDYFYLPEEEWERIQMGGGEGVAMSPFGESGGGAGGAGTGGNGQDGGKVEIVFDAGRDGDGDRGWGGRGSGCGGSAGGGGGGG